MHRVRAILATVVLGTALTPVSAACRPGRAIDLALVQFGVRPSLLLLGVLVGPMVHGALAALLGAL